MYVSGLEENGTVSTEKQYYKAGETVRIIATPDEGYMVNHYYWGANIGLQFSMPIFHGYSVSSQVKQKEMYYESAKASYENLKKNIRIQVKEAWLNLEEAKKRIEATKGVVERAQENLNSKMLRYENGLISQLELNDAISDLNESSLTYVQAVYDAHIALSDLNFAVGMEIEDYE